MNLSKLWETVGAEGPGALQSMGLRRTGRLNISVRLQEGQDQPERAWPKAPCAGRRLILARSWSERLPGERVRGGLGPGIAGNLRAGRALRGAGREQAARSGGVLRAPRQAGWPGLSAGPRRAVRGATQRPQPLGGQRRLGRRRDFVLWALGGAWEPRSRGATVTDPEED